MIFYLFCLGLAVAWPLFGVGRDVFNLFIYSFIFCSFTFPPFPRRSRPAWPNWAWSSVCCRLTWMPRWRSGRSLSTRLCGRARALPAWHTACTCSPGNEWLGVERVESEKTESKKKQQPRPSCWKTSTQVTRPSPSPQPWSIFYSPLSSETLTIHPGYNVCWRLSPSIISSSNLFFFLSLSLPLLRSPRGEGLLKTTLDLFHQAEVRASISALAALVRRRNFH